MSDEKIRRSVMRKSPAFTLIEVLVVVAIIALLVSILLPALGEARDQARSARCLANMQDMGKGVNTFATTHRDRFQILYDISPVANPPELAQIGDTARTLYAYESGPATPNLLAWPAVLAREGGARSVKKNLDWGIPGSVEAMAAKSTLRRFNQLSCPGDKFEIGAPSDPASPTPFSALQPWFWGILSYAANTDILGFRPRATTPPYGPQGPSVWKDGAKSVDNAGADPLGGRLDKVIRPGEVMLFVDGGPTFERFNLAPRHGGIHAGMGTTRGGSTIPRGPLLEYVDIAFNGKLRHERHRRNTVNITFADGHGSFVRRFRGDASINPSGVEDTSGAYPLLPIWKYLPKTRVTPYNSGAYPAP